MLYRKKGTELTLKEVLAKLKGAPTSPVRSVTYSEQDILSAKKVLHRLLNDPARNEVSSITKMKEQVYEL